MRRALLLCLLILAASAALRPAPGLALAVDADAASVRLVACVPALEGEDRSATFEARVRALAGSERMQVRFTLQVRDDLRPAWRRVVAPGLDQWLTSLPGVGRYVYDKTVQNLSAPAAYRAVVRFRWLDEAGAALERSRATSRVCRQPDMRPDLAATRIDVTPGTARYAVALRNDGRTAAGPFAVTLRVGEEQLEPVTVGGLAAGEPALVTFEGAACTPGEQLTVTVDPELAVDERAEDDNVLVAACPP
jgi:hypothetical protein